MAGREAGTITYEVGDIRHIFRTVSPLIIRQWKDVCRELDVPDNELYEIERGKPWERLSEMAYQGLCVWLDRDGRNATKARLIQALRRCELKKAEEAVEGMVVRGPGSGKVSSYPQRNKSPSKHRKSVSVGNTLTAPKDQSSTKNRKDKGAKVTRKDKDYSRENTGQTSMRKKSLSTESNGTPGSNLTNSSPDSNASEPRATRSAARRYSNNSPSKREKWDLKPDEMAAEVTATEIITDKPSRDNWMETYQKMVLHFYTNVVKSEDDHKRALTALMDFRDVFVNRIMFGSIVVVLSCKSLKGLEKLRESYTSGKLEEQFQQSLTRQETLTDIGAKELFLEVYIDPSYFEKCQKTLVARKSARRASKSSKKSRSAKQREEEPVRWSDVLLALQEETIELTNRYTDLQRGRQQLFQGIKQTGIGAQKLASFGDVLTCYSEMKAAGGVETSSVQLLNEFLEIVDLVKRECQELTQKLKTDGEMSAATEVPMSDLELMLHPDFPFKEDMKIVNLELTTSEKRFFVGLLAYIPLLLADLGKVISAIRLVLSQRT